MSVSSKQSRCILPLSFFEGRDIPNFHPESLDSRQWWGEQIRRCREGWNDGGHSVTGRHYFHMNFRNIRMMMEGNRRLSFFPYFSDSDQDTFRIMDAARANGKGVLLITGRGWGKSYLGSTMATYEFTMFPATETIISSSIKKYADLLWKKCMEGVNSLPSQIRPTLYVDRQDEIESGYKEKQNGKEQIKGYRSQMKKIIFEDDPGKTRGGRPDLHLWDEIGSWKNLIRCYQMSEASWWVGGQYTCFPLLMGTGGEMKSGKSEGAMKMFLDPEAYNLMAFDQTEDEKGPSFKTCLFIPADMKFGDYYEDTGISDRAGARKFLEARREKKKDNTDNYNQEIQEFPLKWEEAFYVSGSTTFNTYKLNEQIANIRRNKLEKRIDRGNLEWKRVNGNIVGVEWRRDPKGIFDILEHPKINPTEGRPWGKLYLSGCDSYDSFGVESDNGEDDRSKGAIFMYKRILNITDTSDLFVAKCTLRNKDSNVFYEATAKLNMYYNAKMLYEHTKIGIMDWYERNKFLHLLYPKPKVAYAEAGIKRSKSNNKYGLPMPTKIKEYIIDEYAKYIVAKAHDMYFLSQLEDAINFQWGSSKHDETMAAALCIAASNDMHEVEVKQTARKRRMPTYQKDANGNMVFN